MEEVLVTLTVSISHNRTRTVAFKKKKKKKRKETKTLLHLLQLADHFLKKENRYKGARYVYCVCVTVMLIDLTFIT